LVPTNTMPTLNITENDRPPNRLAKNSAPEKY